MCFFGFFLFLYFFKILFAVIVLFLFAATFLILFIVSIFCFCFCFLWTPIISLNSLSLSKATSSLLSKAIKSSSFSFWYVLSSINEEVLFSGARLIKSSSFSCWYVLSSIKEVLFFCFLAFASLWFLAFASVCFLYFSLIFLAASCAFFPGTKVAILSKSLMVSFDSLFFGVFFYNYKVFYCYLFLLSILNSLF